MWSSPSFSHRGVAQTNRENSRSRTQEHGDSNRGKRTKQGFARRTTGLCFGVRLGDGKDDFAELFTFLKVCVGRDAVVEGPNLVDDGLETTTSNEVQHRS